MMNGQWKTRHQPEKTSGHNSVFNGLPHRPIGTAPLERNPRNRSPSRHGTFPIKPIPRIVASSHGHRIPPTTYRHGSVSLTEATHPRTESSARLTQSLNQGMPPVEVVSPRHSRPNSRRPHFYGSHSGVYVKRTSEPKQSQLYSDRYKRLYRGEPKSRPFERSSFRPKTGQSRYVVEDSDSDDGIIVISDSEEGINGVENGHVKRRERLASTETSRRANEGQTTSRGVVERERTENTRRPEVIRPTTSRPTPRPQSGWTPSIPDERTPLTPEERLGEDAPQGTEWQTMEENFRKMSEDFAEMRRQIGDENYHRWLLRYNEKEDQLARDEILARQIQEEEQSVPPDTREEAQITQDEEMARRLQEEENLRSQYGQNVNVEAMETDSPDSATNDDSDRMEVIHPIPRALSRQMSIPSVEPLEEEGLPIGVRFQHLSQMFDRVFREDSIMDPDFRVFDIFDRLWERHSSTPDSEADLRFEVNVSPSRTRIHLIHFPIDELQDDDFMNLDDLVNHGYRGASQSVIDDATTTGTYRGLSRNGQDQSSGDTHEDDEEDKCSVCLADFERGEDVRRLPCLHYFHVTCIDRWLQTNRICPVCREDITSGT